jgi:glycosyltransferase involved in cell wall biosynthesis
LRLETGRPRHSRTILFVGKLLERKRPRDLIDALACLREKGSQVTAAFVGSGPLLKSLREQARRVSVPAIFHGFKNQSEMPAMYAAADLLVLPSDGLETWGLVVNEAMASGTPAVVSDAVGCGPDLVEAGRTGAVFPLGDVEALAEAIEQVLALDRATVLSHLANKMEIYSPTRAAEGILSAAQMLAQRRRPGAGKNRLLGSSPRPTRENR